MILLAALFAVCAVCVAVVFLLAADAAWAFVAGFAVACAAVVLFNWAIALEARRQRAPFRSDEEWARSRLYESWRRR